MDFWALRPCFIDHLGFTSDFCLVPCRNLFQFLPFFIHCCFCSGNLHGSRHRNKFDQTNAPLPLSLFLDVFSCHYLCLWAGCDLALSLTCLTVLRWIALHVRLFKPHQLQYTPNFRCSPRLAVIRVLCEFSLCPSSHYPFQSCVAHHQVCHPSPGLYQLEQWIQLGSCHHAKTPRLHPTNLQFPGQPSSAVLRRDWIIIKCCRMSCGAILFM